MTPDLPRWVEANGIASDPASWRAQVGDGIALGHDAAHLIVIIGDADPEAVTALADAHADHALLVQLEMADNPPLGDLIERVEGLCDQALDAPERIEAADGVLQHDLDGAAQAAQLYTARRPEVLAEQAHSAGLRPLQREERADLGACVAASSASF